MPQWIKSVLAAAIHIAAWLLADFITTVLSADSSSKAVYGSISGWWCALYVGYVLKVDMKAAVIVIASAFLFGVMSFYLGWNFYHDMPSQTSLEFIAILLVRAIIFSSPIFINALVMYGASWFAKKPGAALTSLR